jgi:gas vesicle protein
MKADKIALGVLGGLATGALLGILFAPAKGCKTRNRILNKSADFADEIKDEFENLSGKIKDNYEKILQEGKDLITDGKSKFEDRKNEIKNLSV